MALVIKNLDKSKSVKFKVNEPFKPHFTTIIVGSPKQGKSNTAINIANHYKDVFTNCVIYSPSVKCDPKFKKIQIKNIEFMKEFDLKEFSDRFEKMILGVENYNNKPKIKMSSEMEKFKKECNIQCIDDNKEVHTLFIFDDLSGNTNVYNKFGSGVLYNSLVRHRHAKSSMMFLVHQYVNIPRCIRNLVEYVLLFDIIPPDQVEEIFNRLKFRCDTRKDQKEKIIELNNYICEATEDKFNFAFIDYEAKKLGFNFE
ncbi:MAG: hypothetical protein GQ557_01625 [Mycoplasmataceae bacterium]|nr:hypothetical protein [Mycoplasmataceae bacterium]